MQTLVGWRSRATQAALSDLALGPAEALTNGRTFIANEIVGPVWGDQAAKDFIKDTSTAQYCGDTLTRWWRLAGRTAKGGLSSPGKVRYNFAERDHLGVVFDPRERLPLPGDAVLHQLPKPNHWQGHVMMCLATHPSGMILIAEGNHGKSMGPSVGILEPAPKYTDATYGMDLTRRQGIGVRWLKASDPYIACCVAPNDSVFGE